MAQLTPQQVQYQIEHIADSRRDEVVSASVLMITLTTTAVILRLAVRKFKKIPFWWDDWLCLIALPFSISGAIIAVSNLALGRHILALSPPEIKHYLKLSYALQISYGTGIILVKLSILVLYRRIFPIAHVSCAWRVCWWVLLMLSASMIVWIIPGIFQCRPIAFFWDQTIPGGQCPVDRIPFFVSTSIINIFSDISILILPIPVLSKLQMGNSKKIGLIGLFLLGGFVCVTSIIRLTYLERLGTEDPTWSQVDTTIWSFVEPTTALICACLPILVPPFCAKIIAITSFMYSSFQSSKKNNKGSVLTIGRQGMRSPKNRDPFANFVSKSMLTVSETELTSPVSSKGPSDHVASAERDPEQGMIFHNQGMDL